MVSPRKQAANAANAAKSTGPRTVAGKRRSKGNATRHGLRAVSPVLPGEDAAGWDAFRAGVVADLRAAGPFETELAERVASLSWRLRRVAAFEVAAATAPPPPPDPFRSYLSFSAPAPEPTPAEVSARLTEAEGELADATRAAGLLARLSAGETFAGDDALFLLWRAVDVLPAPDAEDEDDTPSPVAGPDVEADDFLTALGVPEPLLDAAERWDGWTAEVVRAGLARVAESAGWTLARLLTLADADAADAIADGTATVDRLRAELAEVKDAQAARVRRKAVPDEATLSAVMRYEPYLSKQLAEALDLLRRVQGER